MTATKGLGTYGNGVGTVTPLDHKMAHVGLVAKTAANTIRAGLFWDGSATIVSGKANMSYDVRALSAVTSRGSTAGAVLLTNDAVYNVVTTAAPGSNSRIDVVYLWQREYAIDGTDSNPVIGVVQGTAAASPTVPSLAAFPGAIELARITVPAGVTATNSGTTITQTAPFTATSGGVIPFRNTTERDAGTYVESQLGWLLDSDSPQIYSGSAWVDVSTLALRQQTDTTNAIVPVPKMQGGTGKIQGAGTTVASEAVTFPVAFTSTPMVLVVTSLGSRATGAFNAAGLTTTTAVGTTHTASTTGFTAQLSAAGNLSSANDYYYSWLAIGA